ncbi:MAG: hypothetical protein GX112_08390 [Clostridiaceae bacterium]|nr:hypothetical protein [Clostridiaceae bacterium]
MRKSKRLVGLVSVMVFALAVSLFPIQPAYAYLTIDDGEPVHEYIVDQAAAIANNFAITSAINTIKEGARHEDVFDHVTDRGWLYVTQTHFWDADKSDDDLVDMIAVTYDVINSWQKAKIFWGMALGEYMSGDYVAAYEYLGHIAHLLADQSVPAHAHEDVHETETYEKEYMLFSNTNCMLSGAEAYALQQLGPVEIPEGVNPLYYLFYTVNQIGDYYPCDESGTEYEGDSDTRNGWMDQVYADLGMYSISQPIDDADCAVIREYSYKFAIRATATLFLLFEDAATRRSALTVVIDRVRTDCSHDMLGDADFYAQVNIEGRNFFNEGEKMEDQNDISPGWAYGRQVGLTGIKNLYIRILEEDEPEEDQITDIDPTGGRDIDLVVDLDTGVISGDLSGMCGEQIHCSGNTDESMYSEIWFRILLPNTPPTAHAGADQTYNEGDTIFLNGTFEDPNTEDTHTFLWHLASSTNGQPVPDVHAQDMSFIPRDNGVYTFTFTVTDNWGASGSDEVVITVNNVAPVVQIDHVRDELGAEIGSDVPVTLVGLKTSLTGSFTDAGSADTHSASIDWGDGTVDTDLAQFGDSTGGITGFFSDTHIYTVPGVNTIQSRVTDDDGGIGTQSVSVTVVDASGALVRVIDLLMPLADNPDIQTAMDWLQGEQDGLAENGALDMLDRDEPFAAILMLKSAMLYLEAAEEADPQLDLSAIKGLLALSAKSLVVGVIAEAEATATKANELKKINAAKELALAGDQALTAELKYIAALDAYLEAVRAILGII